MNINKYDVSTYLEPQSHKRLGPYEARDFNNATTTNFYPTHQKVFDLFTYKGKSQSQCLAFHGRQLIYIDNSKKLHIIKTIPN